MCATIMAALQILAIVPLSLCAFVPPLPCPDTPGTCPSLSIPLLQSTSYRRGPHMALHVRLTGIFCFGWHLFAPCTCVAENAVLHYPKMNYS